MFSRFNQLARVTPRGRNLRHLRIIRAFSTSKVSSTRLNSTVFLIGVSLATGFIVGRASSQPNNHEPDHRSLPSGLPRTCCDDDLTAPQLALVGRLKRIVGEENFIDGRQGSTPLTSPFLVGARLGGGGEALAVVTPRTLRQVVNCVQLIVDANCVIVPQGANTGLTGGSVPRRQTGDTRPVVVICMKHLDTFFPIDDGKRVVCMAGAGLASLSQMIPTWFPDRESHSILGSTFLNPTTAAGVALGSGGTQLRKGPAYTDRAMYIKVHRTKFGENVVEIVNNLGISGIEDTDFQEGKGSAVDQLDSYQLDVKEGYTRAMASSSGSQHGKAWAHDADYARQICVHDHTVSRWNANCAGSECNRSEGKVLILATVHDTFPQPLLSTTFWISFDDLATALQFRREVCLDNPDDLPISLEYMNRDAFDVVDQAGRVMASVIKIVGVSGSMLRRLWNSKLWIESLPFEGANLVCDKILHILNPLFPATIPARMMESGKAMDHHVVMTVGEFGNNNLDTLLDRLQSFARKHGKSKIMIHQCQSASEVLSLTAFRFVAAPAFRTWCVGEDVQGISVDYALPKSGGEIPKLSTKPLKRMRYSHFGCNVVHEDLALSRDADANAAKFELKAIVEHDNGGKLPAEHGHGTEYRAPRETQERWKSMDPLNIFNPGVGGLSYKERYKD